MGCVNPQFNQNGLRLEYKRCEKATVWTAVYDPLPFLPEEFNIEPSLNNFCRLWADMFVWSPNHRICSLQGSQRYQTQTWNNPAAIGDAFIHDFVLKPADYVCRFLYVKSPAGGIVTLYIDGVSIMTIDTYASGFTFDNEPESNSFTLSGTARHRLMGAVESKNALSTGYQCIFTAVSLIPVSLS